MKTTVRVIWSLPTCATIRARAGRVNHSRASISAKIVTTQTGRGGPASLRALRFGEPAGADRENGPPNQHWLGRVAPRPTLGEGGKVRLYNNG